MDPIALIFTAMVIGTIVLSPFFGAESRPEFLRPNRKARKSTSPLRPSEWHRPSEWLG
jgi:hypothetical protein